MNKNIKSQMFLIIVICFMAASALAGKMSHVLATLDERQEEINTVNIVIDMGREENNVNWQLTRTEQSVLLGKFLREASSLHKDDDLLNKVKKPISEYKKIKIYFYTNKGEKLYEFGINKGFLRDITGRIIKRDPGRELEYWLFGTAKIRKHQLLASQVMPVFTFEQCKIMGNVIVESSPRQCLLPDNNILLEVTTRPTLESLSINNFESCLEQGEALINVFPRRCMAAGGRVFTEPPKIPDYNIEKDPESEPVDIDNFLKQYKTEQRSF